MTKACEISGKRPLSGNNVSHANNKTRRRFLPNIQNSTFYSELLGDQTFSLSTNGIRTINSKGGLDAWLLQSKNSKLTPKFKKMKKKLIKLVASA
jgi:large subunit ribosomal protein L28